MQDLLTIVINGLLIAAPLYFATMFFLGLHTRHTAPELPILTCIIHEGKRKMTNELERRM